MHTDHLGTPRVITNSSNSVVWRWDNTDSYGNNLPSISLITYNLRFAGQYFDSESSLHYNYYRTYNPATGKYLQPDPIGINGGLNTYNYVNGSPLSGVDPLGLFTKNKDGTFEFKVLGIATFDDNSNVKIEIGYLFTDHNRVPIIAYKRIGMNPPGLDYTADCHGWSFTGGAFWINDNQVQKILDDDYKKVNILNEGNVAIYVLNGEVVHSLTVVNTSKGLMGYGKGGNQPSPYLSELDLGWKTGSKIYYYERKK